MKVVFTIFCNLYVMVAFPQWNYDNQGVIYSNNGNVGIGTSSPSVWFTSRVFEISDDRPVLKLTSKTTNLATITFTNNAISSSTHYGEFHLNHQFNPSVNNQSLLRFYSYPGEGIMTLKSNGSVGIGAIPEAKLSIRTSTAMQGAIISNCDASGIQSHFGLTTADQPRIGLATESYFNIYNNGRWIFNSGNTSGGSTLPISFQINDVSRLFINTDGNIGIGTMLPGNPNGYKLAVKGKIGAHEVQVENSSATWADYVFEPDYDLMPLEKVEAFVKENKHLPEIPSKSEVEQNGHKLGEMDVLLLKKVEELTLYVIELKRELSDQKKLTTQQAEVIELLKAEIASVKSN